MKTTNGKLQGLLIIEPDVFGDARGYFLETWNRRRYSETGIQVDFVQDNISMSRKSILRGLHFQNPHPQGKLVSVLLGEVLDVAVDIRVGSPTFGQWESVLISSENKRQLFIPPGFAHGFMVRSETAIFHYKCTDFYSAKDELCVRWNDPNVGIDWTLDNRTAAAGRSDGSTGLLEPILSGKDAVAPCLCDVPSERLFRFAGSTSRIPESRAVSSPEVRL